jgi:YD repeat-containing protein
VTETLGLTTRVITYTYDGLQRLSSAGESPGTRYGYGYDDAGNRTGVWLNGTRVLTQTYNKSSFLRPTPPAIAAWSAKVLVPDAPTGTSVACAIHSAIQCLPLS